MGLRGSRRKFRKIFEKFLYKSFVCSFARSFENFSNFSSRRRDRFGPKIAKFRAILAIFRPFEDFEFEKAPKQSIWIRFELQGPPKGPAARIEFKCYSLVIDNVVCRQLIHRFSSYFLLVSLLLAATFFWPLSSDYMRLVRCMCSEGCPKWVNPKLSAPCPLSNMVKPITRKKRWFIMKDVDPWIHGSAAGAAARIC